MSVYCKMTYCPFWAEDNLCRKEFTFIDENGHCTNVWRKGQPIANAAQEQIGEEFKKNIEVREAEEVLEDGGNEQNESNDA